MIRAKAARKLVRNKELRGPEALALVVLPTPELQEQSMRVAREKGIHADTIRFFGRRASAGQGGARKPKPGAAANPAPPPETKKILTLDEVIESLIARTAARSLRP